jgi:hypothetical protein
MRLEGHNKTLNENGLPDGIFANKKYQFGYNLESFEKL